MTEHIDIQNPENYSQAHYLFFETKLFDPKTKREELEKICMTLAHLPTEEAKALLKKFQSNDRAADVSWLECAVEENSFHFLSAENEQEEKDMIALKLYYKKEDEIIEAIGKCTVHEFKLTEYEIEDEALQNLLTECDNEQERKDFEIQISVIHDLKVIEETQLNDLKNNIEITEKVIAKIKQNITTERYKELGRSEIESIRFDGEDW